MFLFLHFKLLSQDVEKNFAKRAFKLEFHWSAYKKEKNLQHTLAKKTSHVAHRSHFSHAHTLKSKGKRKQKRKRCYKN